MSGGITYDARVYRTEVYKGSKVTTYKVRWKVGGRLWKAGFRTAAQADSFRSALLTAARHGEAFSLPTGRPTAWEREKAATSWYEFACTYVDMKWKQASAKYRKDIARALTAATPAMLAEGRGRPGDADIRRALLRWGFNKPAARASRQIQRCLGRPALQRCPWRRTADRHLPARLDQSAPDGSDCRGRSLAARPAPI